MVDNLNNTPDRLLLGDNVFKPSVFTAAGANTYPEGTVLGRNTSTSKFEVYASGGSNGTDVPVAVLRNELITTGSGDTNIRAIVGGLLQEDRVTEFGVGVLSTLVQDELRAASGIRLKEVTELQFFDNS